MYILLQLNTAVIVHTLSCFKQSLERNADPLLIPLFGIVFYNKKY